VDLLVQLLLKSLVEQVVLLPLVGVTTRHQQALVVEMVLLPQDAVFLSVQL
jgi:hypothetical protein